MTVATSTANVTKGLAGLISIHAGGTFITVLVYLRIEKPGATFVADIGNIRSGTTPFAARVTYEIFGAFWAWVASSCARFDSISVQVAL